MGFRLASSATKRKLPPSLWALFQLSLPKSSALMTSPSDTAVGAPGPSPSASRCREMPVPSPSLAVIFSMRMKAGALLDAPPTNSSCSKGSVWSCATASGLRAMGYSGAAGDS